MIRNIITILAAAIITAGCTADDSKKHEVNNSLLEGLIEKTGLEVVEPSGLGISHDGSYLWTVSDNENIIYKILTDGEIIDKIEAEGYDFEGVVQISDSSLAVILEREREVLIIDFAGRELNRKKIDISGDLNSGLEGIAYNPEKEIFYVLNEKTPGMLFFLDKNLNEISRTELNFASDYSGLHYNTADSTLWIISDENKKIYKCFPDLSAIMDSVKVNIPQMEGIAVDAARKLVYIISDATGELYKYRMR